MISVDDIKDEDSLRKWLEALPQEDEAKQAEARRIAVTLASRAALRVLPVFWHWTLRSPAARNRDLTALPTFLRLLISSVFAISPTEEIRAAATFANAAFANSDAGLADANAAFADANAAATAANAAAAAFADANAATRAATRVAATANSDAALAAIWANLRQDAAGVMAGRTGFDQPLWHDEVLFRDLWQDIQKTVSERKDGADWQFWLDWYEQMLDPVSHPPNWPLLEQIALIDPEVWYAGPKAVSEAVEALRDSGDRHASTGQTSFAKSANAADARVDKLQRLFEGLAKRLTNVTEHNSDLSEKLAQAEEQAQSLGAQLSELGRVAEKERARIDGFERDLQAKFTAELDAAKAALEQSAIFRAPQELWKTKEQEHRKEAKWAYGIFIAALLVTIGLLVGVLYGISQQSDLVTRLLTPSWCDPMVYSEGCTGFSTRGILVGASIFTVFTLMLWFSRLKMKEFLAERHLALDARERRAFMESYTRLLAVGEGQVEEGLTEARKAEIQAEVRAHRAIVYSAVFRPSSDGIVRDEGGIDPSIAAAISKLLTR